MLTLCEFHFSYESLWKFQIKVSLLLQSQAACYLRIHHLERKGAVSRNSPVLEDSLRCQEGLCSVRILGRAGEGFWGDNPDDPGVVGRVSEYWTLEGRGSGPLTHGFFSIANTTELCGLQLWNCRCGPSDTKLNDDFQLHGVKGPKLPHCSKVNCISPF